MDLPGDRSPHMFSSFPLGLPLPLEIWGRNYSRIGAYKRYSISTTTVKGLSGVPCSLVPFHFCPMLPCSRSFSSFVPYNISAYRIPPTLNTPTPSKNKTTQKKQHSNINNHVLCVTLRNSVKLTSRVLFLPRLDLFNVAINSSRILELLLTLPLRW